MNNDMNNNMNNNMTFDPNTGVPIQQNNQQPVNQQIIKQPIMINEKQINSQPTLENSSIQQLNTENIVLEQNQDNEQQIQNIETTQINEPALNQNEFQSIPTVEQSQQDFINNVQSMNQEKKEEKKEGINFVFIIILFVIILAAIYFLFPLLLKYI